MRSPGRAGLGVAPQHPPPRPSAGAEPAAGGHLGDAGTEQTSRAGPVRGVLGCEGGAERGRGWHSTARGAHGAQGAEARAGGSCCYWGGNLHCPQSVSATGFSEQHFASFFLTANEVSPEAIAMLSTEINVFSYVTYFQWHGLILPGKGGLSSHIEARVENKSLW